MFKFVFKFTAALMPRDGVESDEWKGVCHREKETDVYVCSSTDR